MNGSLAKQLHVAKITWKSMLAYQADTWLGAGVSGFRVLLMFLLWSAIFAGRPEVGGYTLPMMVTYALVTSMLERLQNDKTALLEQSDVVTLHVPLLPATKGLINAGKLCLNNYIRLAFFDVNGWKESSRCDSARRDIKSGEEIIK